MAKKKFRSAVKVLDEAEMHALQLRVVERIAEAAGECVRLLVAIITLVYGAR
jgi:hypothetical protein